MTTEALTAAGLDADRHRRWAGERLGRQRPARRRRPLRGRGGRVRQGVPDAPSDGGGGQQRRARPPRVLRVGWRRWRTRSWSSPAGRETVLASADDPGARRVAARVGRGVRRFGFDESTPIIRITDVVQRADATEARVVIRGGRSIRVRLQVPGIHNLRNAVAALGAVDALGGKLEPAAARARRVHGRGTPVRAARRARRRGGRGRLRPSSFRARGDALGCAAGISWAPPRGRLSAAPVLPDRGPR